MGILFELILHPQAVSHNTLLQLSQLTNVLLDCPSMGCALSIFLSSVDVAGMTGGVVSSSPLTLPSCVSVSSVSPCCSVVFPLCWGLLISSFDSSFLLLMLEHRATSCYVVSMDVGLLLIHSSHIQYVACNNSPCLSCSSGLRLISMSWSSNI